MLNVRTLHEEIDFERFSELYRQKSQGIPADVDFLRHGTTYIVTYPDQPDRWVAGYVINDQPGYRYLTVLEGVNTQALLAQHAIQETEIVEIGAIWMDIRALGQKGRWLVYQYMMGDAYATEKNIVLGGTAHARIRDFQMQVTKYPFFEGDIRLGDQVHHIWEYYARRDELWADFFLATLHEFGGVKRGSNEHTYIHKKAA